MQVLVCLQDRVLFCSSSDPDFWRELVFGSVALLVSEESLKVHEPETCSLLFRLNRQTVGLSVRGLAFRPSLLLLKQLRRRLTLEGLDALPLIINGLRQRVLTLDRDFLSMDSRLMTRVCQSTLRGQTDSRLLGWSHFVRGLTSPDWSTPTNHEALHFRVSLPPKGQSVAEEDSSYFSSVSSSGSSADQDLKLFLKEYQELRFKALEETEQTPPIKRPANFKGVMEGKEDGDTILLPLPFESLTFDRERPLEKDVDCAVEEEAETEDLFVRQSVDLFKRLYSAFPELAAQVLETRLTRHLYCRIRLGHSHEPLDFSSSFVGTKVSPVSLPLPVLDEEKPQQQESTV